MKNSPLKFAKTETEINEESKNNSIKSAPNSSSELVCANCGIPNENEQTGKKTILYTASCPSKHNFCFKCIFNHFFLNIGDFISNSEKNKKRIILTCPLCSNLSYSGEIIFNSIDFKKCIKYYIDNDIPKDYNKNLGNCPIHNNNLINYCDTCSKYICTYCSKNEHKKHKFQSISSKENEIKEKIKNIPLKIHNFDSKINEIHTKNMANYKDVYQRTIKEIDACIKSLNDLKVSFEKEMKKNFVYYNTFIDILSMSYGTFYSQIKLLKLPFYDFGIPYLNFLYNINEELNTIKLNVTKSIFEEVEKNRKIFENLTKKEAISSTIKINSSFTKIKEYKCIKTIEDHQNYIRDMIINIKEKKVITCSDDKLIKIFDINNDYKCIQNLKGHNETINKIIYMQDPNFLLSASEDKLIKIWELKNPQTYEFKCNHSLKGHNGGVILLDLINDDNGENKGTFVSASTDNCIRIWEPEKDYKKVSEIKDAHSAKITGLIVYNNNQKLISSSEDKTIKIFDLKTQNNLIKTIKDHTDIITQITLYNDDKLLISCSNDCTFGLIHTINNFNFVSKTKHQKMPVLFVKIIFNTVFATVSQDKTICLWDVLIEEKIIEEEIEDPKNKKDKKKEKKKKEEKKEEKKEDKKEEDKKEEEEKKEEEKKEEEKIKKEYTITLRCICTIDIFKWQIHDLCYCLEKNILYCASQDKLIHAIKLINTDEYNGDHSKNIIWKELGTLKGHERDVTIVKMIDSEIVISTSNDFRIKLWKDQ